MSAGEWGVALCTIVAVLVNVAFIMFFLWRAWPEFTSYMQGMLYMYCPRLRPWLEKTEDATPASPTEEPAEVELDTADITVTTNKAPEVYRHATIVI